MAAVTFSVTVKNSDANRIMDNVDALFPGRLETSYTPQQWVCKALSSFLNTHTKEYEKKNTAVSDLQFEEPNK